MAASNSPSLRNCWSCYVLLIIVTGASFWTPVRLTPTARCWLAWMLLPLQLRHLSCSDGLNSEKRGLFQWNLWLSLKRSFLDCFLTFGFGKLSVQEFNCRIKSCLVCLLVLTGCRRVLCLCFMLVLGAMCGWEIEWELMLRLIKKLGAVKELRLLQTVTRRCSGNLIGFAVRFPEFWGTLQCSDLQPQT